MVVGMPCRIEWGLHMTVELSVVIPIIVSVVSVSFAIFFGVSNYRRTDTKDIEQRTVERTETNMKLDEISRNVTDIKYDISATKKEVSALSERMASVEASTKQAHHRLDRMESDKEA